MMFHCHVLLLLLIAGTSLCSEVVVLDTSTFEKLTQASTGHTTGDWLVKFYAPWCGHCKTLAPILDEVANELKGIVNIAKVDVTQSRDLGTRFDIKGYPTLKFFSKGKIYTYEGRRSVEDLVAYVKGGFESSSPEDVPKVSTYFSDMTKRFTTVYNDAKKDITAGNYLTPNVYLMVLPMIFALVFFLLIIVPGAPESHQVSGKAAPKKVAAAGTKKQD